VAANFDAIFGGLPDAQPAPAGGGASSPNFDALFSNLPDAQASSSTAVASMPGRTVLTVRPNNVAQPDVQPAPQPPAPDRSGIVNKVDAGVRGAADMLSFGLADEIAAGGDALFNPIFGTGASAPTFGERYDQNLAKQRGIDNADVQQNPVERIGGQLAGGVLLPGAAADTLAGRAVVGGATGGLYGFGSGEGGIGNRLGGAVTGTGLGAVAGPAASVLTSAAGAVAKPVFNAASRAISPIRGYINTESEAARRVASALRRDQAADDVPTIGDRLAASVNDQPMIVADSGGRTTQALARSAANTSPEARTALDRAVNDRFETQSPRTTAFLRTLTGATGDHEGALTRLQDAARRANRPAYQAAYTAGDRQVWSPELERLSAAPSVQQALRSAVTKWRDWQVHDGFGAANAPAMVSNGGILNLGNGRGMPVFPNIQFWDYAARHIADRAEQARRSGAMQEAARLGGLERQLKSELDRIVPQYQRARQGAARFFGSQDALEAGRSFVAADMGTQEARRAIDQMSAPERELFRQGFASELIRRVNESGDRRSVLNQMFLGGSPAARSRIEIALGPQSAHRLEAFLRVENIMDGLRRAVQGNSTTARQLTEMGLAGGAVAGGEYLKDGTISPAHAIAAALAFGGLRHGAKVIDEKVARRVGEMLASDDPRVMQRALDGAANNRTMMDAIRGAESRITGLIGAGASGTAGPSAQDVATKLLTNAPSKADDQKKP
jgi:hypothetical protein